MLRARERTPTPYPFDVFTFGLALESIKEFASVSHGIRTLVVATSLWAKCEGEAHTPKSGKLESYRTPKNSELDYKGQISLHLSVLGVIEKVLKCRCPKWPRMKHSDIYSPSYGQKKGRESNWQFDS